MGLKWFRARLSMKKEASKVPTLTGLYRRVSCFESDISTKEENKTFAAPSTINDSTISTNNEKTQHNHLKTDLTSQSSSLPITNLKEDSNYTNAESSTENTNIKEKSLISNEQLNKTNKNQSDMKSNIYSDNEIVI